MEKYSLEKAQEEASQLQEKIESGEAGSYEEAEKSLGNQKEKILTKEDKAEIFHAAMKEFGDVEDIVKMVESADKQFVEELDPAVAGFLRRTIDSPEHSSKELGYRQVTQMAEDVVHSIRSNLHKLEETQGKQTSETGRAKEEIESILRGISAEEDPQRVLTKVEDAISIFDKLITKIDDQRAEQHRARKGMSGATEENRQRSRREFLRAEDTLNRDMSGSVLDTYQRESNRLGGVVAEANSKLDSLDRQFVDLSDEKKIRFKRLLIQLIN